MSGDVWPDQGDLDPRRIWGIPEQAWQTVSDLAKIYGWTLDQACAQLSLVLTRPALPTGRSWVSPQARHPYAYRKRPGRPKRRRPR